MDLVLASVSALLLLLLGAPGGAVPLRLPDTAGIDGQLTANLAVDHFFSLWLVFNNDQLDTSDEPFTILAPQNAAVSRDDAVLTRPELVKRMLLDHVVLGQQLDLLNMTEGSSAALTTLGGKPLSLRRRGERWFANEAAVLEPRVKVPNGVVVVLDNYLYPEDRLVVEKESEEAEEAEEQPDKKPATGSSSGNSFAEKATQVLSFLKSGVRVFQHFLARSNVSQLLSDSEEYTVLVPTDHAFQRWHPIDWGFYPFSVPEFTESVIINHFLRGNLRQAAIRDGQAAKTVGGRDVVFRRTAGAGGASLLVNGASIVRGDTPLDAGNIMFISEVLFVSETIVSRLHQENRDKETPPLLAFPWFGAQFLSHAFLALERDRRFGHITRFLNLADLAQHVSGTGYTFFVPVDAAFDRVGLDRMPDNYLSTGRGLQILLNHFVKGRLYERDLKDGTRLATLGNRTIHVSTTKDSIKVNNATIVESEIFVYNLGTMFYIDRVLFAEDIAGEEDGREPTTTASSISSSSTAASTSSESALFSLEPDAELIPSELGTEMSSGSGSSSNQPESSPDILLMEDAGQTQEAVLAAEEAVVPEDKQKAAD